MVLARSATTASGRTVLGFGVGAKSGGMKKGDVFGCAVKRSVAKLRVWIKKLDGKVSGFPGILRSPTKLQASRCCSIEGCEGRSGRSGPIYGGQNPADC